MIIQRRDSRPGWERGLTLIEVVISLFLLSLMSVIVVQSYRSGLMIWERQGSENRKLDTSRVLMNRLRSQIKSAYAWNYRDELKENLYFEGREDFLDFTALVGFTSRRPNGVIHALRYSLEDDPDAEGKMLVLEEYAWPRRGFPEGEEPLLRESVSGVEELRFSYKVRTLRSAAAGETEEGEWTDSWSGGPRTNRRNQVSETLEAISVSIKMYGEGEEEKEMVSIVPVMRPWEGTGR